MAKYATNVSGAILLPSSIQVTESISGSVVPLAMFENNHCQHHLTKQPCCPSTAVYFVPNYLGLYSVNVISTENSVQTTFGPTFDLLRVKSPPICKGSSFSSFDSGKISPPTIFNSIGSTNSWFWEIKLLREVFCFKAMQNINFLTGGFYIWSPFQHRRGSLAYSTPEMNIGWPSVPLIVLTLDHILLMF